MISDWDVEGVFLMSTVLPNCLEKNYDLIFPWALNTGNSEVELNLRNAVFSELGMSISVLMAEQVDVFFPPSLQMVFDFFLTAAVSHGNGLLGCGRAVMCLSRTFGTP